MDGSRHQRELTYLAVSLVKEHPHVSPVYLESLRLQLQLLRPVLFRFPPKMKAVHLFLGCQQPEREAKGGSVAGGRGGV